MALPQSAADLLLPFRSEASPHFLLRSACHQREHCRQPQASVSIWLNSLASLQTNTSGKAASPSRLGFERGARGIPSFV